jgi:hypothetical protein
LAEVTPLERAIKDYAEGKCISVHLAAVKYGVSEEDVQKGFVALKEGNR